MANELLLGFQQIKDIYDRARNVPEVKAAIEISVAQHNAEIREMLGLFAVPKMDWMQTFRSNAAGRLQTGDEYSRADPRKFTTYDVAYPIYQGNGAWGGNKVALAKMSVKDVNDQLSNLLKSDRDWLRDHMLAALFTNTTRTFSDPIKGSLTVQPLAISSDGVKYYKAYSGGTVATDTHYYAQAAAIDDSNNPFLALNQELTEHPENAGEVVTFISRSQHSAVTGLAEFVFASDRNVSVGSNTDKVNGTLGVMYPGELLGYLKESHQWIVEWPMIPSGYTITVTTNGDAPLAMREEPESELQGFQAQGEIDDFPYYSEQWFRRCGFGAWNRVGAVVGYHGTSGSYAIPTGYTAPIA